MVSQEKLNVSQRAHVPGYASGKGAPGPRSERVLGF